MRLIFGILAAAAGIYSILLLIRIIMSWFGSFVSGRFVDFLFRITDPYLDWWRSHLNLRVGFLDFSAVAAITALSLLQSIFYSVSRFERITIGSILAIVLISVWNVFSFITGFYLIVFILRLIAYLTNRNIYSTFWQAIDSICKPLLYRLNRIIFGSRIPNYLTGIIISCLILAAVLVIGNIAVPRIAFLIAGIPF